MPISVLCPSCSATVHAPDSAAGKRAKCPKCHEIMILPSNEPEDVVEDVEDFEVVDEPAPKRKPRVVVDDDEDDEDDTPVKKKPKSRGGETTSAKRKARVVVADDDDDDFEEDEERPSRTSKKGSQANRPRKNGKSKSSDGPPKGLLIGGGLLLVLLIAGGLYFALRGGSGSGSTSSTSSASKGPNWVKFEAPDGSFVSAFPDGAPEPETLESLAQKSGGGNANPEDVKKGMDVLKTLGVKMEGWSREYQGRRYTVFVMAAPPALAAQFTPEAIMQQGAGQKGAGQNKDLVKSESAFSSGGIQGKQMVTQNKATNRWSFARVGTPGQGKILAIVVESEKEISADDALALAFFEKVQWKK